MKHPLRYLLIFYGGCQIFTPMSLPAMSGWHSISNVTAKASTFRGSFNKATQWKATSGLRYLSNRTVYGINGVALLNSPQYFTDSFKTIEAGGVGLNFIHIFKSHIRLALLSETIANGKSYFSANNTVYTSIDISRSFEASLLAGFNWQELNYQPNVVKKSIFYSGLGLRYRSSKVFAYSLNYTLLRYRRTLKLAQNNMIHEFTLGLNYKPSAILKFKFSSFVGLLKNQKGYIGLQTIAYWQINQYLRYNISLRWRAGRYANVISPTSLANDWQIRSAIRYKVRLF